MTFTPTDRFATEAERDAYFAPGNDETWGPGMWVKCEACPDHYGNSSYHHRDAHTT